jgi:tRNA modification GTPase
VIKELRMTIDTYEEGAVLREGVLAIICGKTNVGKSSLMNLLLKRDRVIVSPIPGTTRDTVEELVNIKGIPVRLVDTAGIVGTKNSVEREGVRRSKRYIDLADIVIFMVDNSAALTKADLDIIKLIKEKKKLVVINKADLPSRLNKVKLKNIFGKEKILEISVGERRNITDLEKMLADIIYKGGFSQGEPFIVSNARHKELLDMALDNMLSVKRGIASDMAPELLAVDMKEAIDNLGYIIGKSISDDILDRIFDKFCIGK